MCRFALVVPLMLMLSACTGPLPGRVLLTEDTKDQYVQLREEWGSCQIITSGHVEDRPDLKALRELHGDLSFICTEIHGVQNPRIVIESENKGQYQVVYSLGDRNKTLEVIAKPLGLVVTREEREVKAITIRETPGGHRLRRAAEDKRTDVDRVCCNSYGWLLDGVTADELARFLETRYCRRVVNLTSLEGRWSILLSEKAAKMGPPNGDPAALDDLGLELRWEKVKIPVTVVKDKPK
jgi:hypothetical protein